MEKIRDNAMEAMKKYRGGWLQLGQLLTDIAFSGDFKNWGFDDFITYCKEELGITPETAKSMMKAYDYIKQNEPSVLNTVEEGKIPYVPDFNAINALAKNRKGDKLGESLAEDLHKRIFKDEKSKDAAVEEMRGAVNSKSEAMDDVKAETKKMKKLVKKADDQIHQTSTCPTAVIELSEKLATEVDKIEII